MTLRQITLCVTLLLVGVIGSSAKADELNGPKGKPNVILILVDDLGWADLGVTGSSFHETPRIDQFASQGTLFSSAYAVSPPQVQSEVAVTNLFNDTKRESQNSMMSFRTSESRMTYCQLNPKGRARGPHASGKRKVGFQCQRRVSLAEG